MSAPSREVPKFSSFRSKNSVPQQKQPSPPSTASKRHLSTEGHHHSLKRQRTSERQYSSSNHDQTSHKYPPKPSDTRHRDKRQPCTTSDSLLIQHDDDDRNLFVFDRNGDPQNVIYDRLHKYSIPPYQRIGFGNVVGLHTIFKIDRDESAIDKVVITDTSITTKKNPQRLLLKRQRTKELSVFEIRGKDELDLDQDFVKFPLSTGDSDAALIDDPPDSCRDIGCSADSVSQEYQKREFKTEATAADLRARQRNVELVRATKADPSNLQTWLDLATHQEHLVSSGADTHSLNNTERQTLADMRISIYEKALKHFPSSETHECEPLALELLREASLVWSSQKYLQRLQEILQQHPKSFSIWSLYMDAHQANSTNFRFEDVKAFFIRNLRTFGSRVESDPDPETQKLILYLILRYTVFLLDTGYEELSIATWQALCEYHFFRPKLLATCDTSQVLSNFEHFWENETPRLGEVGANGWCASQENDPASDQYISIVAERQDPGLPFKSFATLERSTSQSLLFPGRTMDQAGNEDPFHVVFFSDICDVLEATAAGFDQCHLLDALLCYLGLPSIPSASATGLRAQLPLEWRFNSFIHQGLLQLDLWDDNGDDLNTQRAQHYQVSTELLFSRAFQTISVPALSDEGRHPQRSREHTTQFVGRILSSIVKRFPGDDNLAEYYLAFELSCFPEAAPKVAKNLLKQRPSSLRLYNACATIEASLGRVERAAQIWSGAINMKDSLPEAAQEELILLWRGWVWCDLEANQLRKALIHLNSFGGPASLNDDEPTHVSPASVLRLRNAFKDGFWYSVGRTRPHLVALNVEMLALVAYLTEPDALQASVTAVHEYCNIVKTQTAGNRLLLEAFHQIKAGIIDYHVRHKRPYKPAFVRSEMEASIALFPNNNIFLELYRDNEVRFRLDDRSTAYCDMVICD
ncbi:DUF1740-domain-containing protein [Aureobasidium subglaciale]|nr:DUF1740-domain-containing protein [Aureobasidium subglaciale]KAI5227658.1 DUF1740-domain-containing protein [Aureobasidium subglaciale]KAI5230902.1 DUF1740-domain-containing protein [Aureobasidium subglaciale]KAI5265101.1 DUF1740-domain-containing protein [Aureobasidium subglaciale]